MSHVIEKAIENIRHAYERQRPPAATDVIVVMNAASEKAASARQAEALQLGVDCPHDSPSPYGWNFDRGRPARFCEDCGYHLGRHERSGDRRPPRNTDYAGNQPEEK